MTEEGFEYVLGLVDELSGPTKAETDALKRLQGEIGATEKALRQLEVQQLKYKEQSLGGIAKQMGVEIGRAKVHLKDLERELKAAGEEAAFFDKLSKPGPTGGGDKDKGIFGDVFTATLLANETERMARAVGRGAREMVEFAISASEFKENTELAYAAVQGSAAGGETAFNEINQAARNAHLGVENAHELAETLEIQGLTDTHLIAKTIGAEAALIRTGQIEGAQRLKSIIERSLVTGHLDVGHGKGAGKRLTGLGISAALAHELAQGKTSVEDGLEKIDQAITDGAIGKAAAKKFGIEDFKTDFGNAFRSIASVDLTKFNASLQDADKYVQEITQDGAPLHGIFQSLVDDAATTVSEMRELSATAIDVTTSMGSVGTAFDDAFKNTAPAVLRGLEVGFTELAGAADYLATGVEQVGASLAGLADVAIEGPQKAWANWTKTIADLKGQYESDAAKRSALIDRIISGNEGLANSEKAVGFHAQRAAKHVEAAYADIAKAHHTKSLTVEDLVFGEKGEQGIADFTRWLDDRESGGFVAGLGSDGQFHFGRGGTGAAGPSGGSAASAAGASAALAGAGGKLVHFEWHGNLYVGGEERSDLRSIAESAMADVLERFKNELLSGP